MTFLCSCRIQYLPDRSCGCNHYLPFLQVFIIQTLQRKVTSEKLLLCLHLYMQALKDRVSIAMHCLLYPSIYLVLPCGTLLSSLE